MLNVTPESDSLVSQPQYQYKSSSSSSSSWNIHPTIRTSKAARIFNKVGLYSLYRFVLMKQGYQNPFTAVLKITSHCNLQCTHCPWHGASTPDLDVSFWKAKIDEVYALGVTNIAIEGGEPSLYKELPTLIDYIHTKGLSVVLFTNGTQSLQGLNPDIFYFSIEGDAETHDRIRGKGTFQKALEQLAYCKKHHHKTLAVATLSAENYQQIEALTESIYPHVDTLMFSFMYPYKNSVDAPIPKNDLPLIIQRILQLKKRYPHIYNSKKALQIVAVGKGIGHVCYPWWNIHIQPDGTLTHHCVVSQLEACDCNKCNLPCYSEVYLGANFHPSSLLLYLKFRGRL